MRWFIKKLKIELPYDLAISLQGIYPEKTKILIQKDTSTPMFTAALFIIAKIPYLNVHQETVNKEVVEEEPRWRRSRTGRTLSPPQIHQKSI